MLEHADQLLLSVLLSEGTYDVKFSRAPCEPTHPFAMLWRLQPWTEAVYGTIYRFSLRHLAHCMPSHTTNVNALRDNVVNGQGMNREAGYPQYVKQRFAHKKAPRTVRCHKYSYMARADPLYSANHNSH